VYKPYPIPERNGSENNTLWYCTCLDKSNKRVTTAPFQRSVTERWPETGLWKHLPAVKYTENTIQLIVSRHSQSNPIELNFNRTQSISIEFNPWNNGSSSIEFGNRTKSNTELCVSSISEHQTLSNRSNQIELDQLDNVRLSSATELNRTQSNRLRSIVFG
jgi:hypothetical protein